MRRHPTIILCKLAAAAAAVATATLAHAEGRKPMGLPEAREHFVCKTRVSFSDGHGTQVAYMNSTGGVFLWYPGNSAVVPGRWKIEEATIKNLTFQVLCFQYGLDTYNPVTRERGGKWGCQPADVWAWSTVDRADGDVFGLERRGGAVPFRLSKERTTIADLQQNIRPPKAKQSKPVPDPGCPPPVADLARDATEHAMKLEGADAHPH